MDKKLCNTLNVFVIIAAVAILAVAWYGNHKMEEAKATLIKDNAEHREILAGAEKQLRLANSLLVRTKANEQLADLLALQVNRVTGVSAGSSVRKLQYLKQAANGVAEKLSQLPRGEKVALFGICGKLWSAARAKGVPEVVLVRWSVLGEEEKDVTEFGISGAIAENLNIKCT